jgi:hypothetical protein
MTMSSKLLAMGIGPALNNEMISQTSQGEVAIIGGQ